MAQSVTITEINDPGHNPELNGIQKIIWKWDTMDSGEIKPSLNKTTHKYSGECVRLITVPGSPAPSDKYDVIILDEDGYDILGGGGTDRSNTNTETVHATNLGACVHTTLSLKVIDPGELQSKGTTILYIR